MFNALLGTVTPIPLPITAPYYLGVKVGVDDEMAPRRSVTSVPYALRAGCNPGDRMTCCAGASNTLGTGLCTTGVRRSNVSGSGWSACVGEVRLNCSASCVDLQTDPANCGT